MGNYKKLLLIILSVFLAAAGIIRYRNEKVNYNLTHISGIRICDEAEIASAIDGKELLEDTDSTARLIQCDGASVPYVADENCFYLNQNYSHDISDGTITCSSGYEAYILKDYYAGKRAEAITYRNRFSLFLVSSTEYRKCGLILTGMPVACIRSTDEILKDYTQGEFSLCVCGDTSSKTEKVFAEPNSGEIKTNDSGEVYTVKLIEGKQNFLGMGEYDSWQINLISEEDDTFCRQMLAAEVWNGICGDSNLQRPYRYAELIVNNRYLGLCLLTPKINSEYFGSVEMATVRDANDFDTRQELLQTVTPESLARYFLFLQATYAYKNLDDSFFVVNGEQLMPGRVEYSFNTYPSEQRWRTYRGEQRAFTAEEFGVDEGTLACVGSLWQKARKTVLSDETISTKIDNIFSYLFDNGTIINFDYYSQKCEDLKSFVTRRYALLDSIYAGEKLPALIPEAPETEETAYNGTVDYVRLSVSGEDCTQEIKLYIKDGKTAYFFLPSFTTDKNTEWIIDSAEHEVTYSEKEITIDGVTYPLKIMHSENISAMFIETANSTLEYVNTQKGNREPGTMICISKNGKTDSSGDISELKSRGSSSFSRVKGSYQMKMAEPTNVMNMGKAEKWILQANIYDATLLRNKITYDMAKKLGLRFAIDSEYTDVYFNGEYKGNYLICEKVEIGENRIDLANTGDSYLLAFDRYDEDEATFIDYFGRETGIKYPKNVNEEEKKTIAEKIAAIERQITECNSYTDYRKLENLIDMPSFADMYIIHFLTNEVDSNAYSTFYYYDGDDGKLYAGPAWDYDRAYGNEITDVGNYAEVDSYLHGIPEQLMDIPYFKNYVKEIVEEKYREYLFSFSENELNTTAAEIAKSSAMNRILYNTVDQTFIDTGSPEANILYLSDYYGIRLDLLNGYLNGKCHIIKIDESAERGRAVWVKDGETISQAVIDYLCKKNECDHFVFENGSGFWPGYKVHSDLTLYCR